MLNNTTLTQLRALKLLGFADALEQQQLQAVNANLDFRRTSKWGVFIRR